MVARSGGHIAAGGGPAYRAIGRHSDGSGDTGPSYDARLVRLRPAPWSPLRPPLAHTRCPVAQPLCAKMLNWYPGALPGEMCAALAQRGTPAHTSPPTALFLQEEAHLLYARLDA